MITLGVVLAPGYANKDSQVLLSPFRANPLTVAEEEKLDQAKGDARKIQDIINESTYEFDHTLFDGSLCDVNDKICDVWMPLAYFLHQKQGDCDDIFALAHYLHHKKGVGMYLADKDKKEPNHFLYVYRGDNGFYGVNSINNSEFRAPQYNTIDELARYLKIPEYDYYQILTFPNEDDILLYNFDFRKKTKWGLKHYFD